MRISGVLGGFLSTVVAGLLLDKLGEIPIWFSFLIGVFCVSLVLILIEPPKKGKQKIN